MNIQEEIKKILERQLDESRKKNTPTHYAIYNGKDKLEGEADCVLFIAIKDSEIRSSLLGYLSISDLRAFKEAFDNIEVEVLEKIYNRDRGNLK